MFFNSDYNDLMPPVPETGAMSPEKTGFPRFLEILKSQYDVLLKVNILFMLSCIPVVTIPPGLFTMNRLVRQMAQNQPVGNWWETFRQCWKQSVPAFLLTALPLVGSGVGMWFYLGRAEENLLFLLPFLVCSTIFLVTLLSSGCFCSLLDSGKGWKESMRLALLLGVAKPLRTVPAALCGYGLPLLGILFLPLSGLYLILIGFSLPCLIGNFLLRTLLKLCVDKGETVSPDV